MPTKTRTRSARLIFFGHKSLDMSDRAPKKQKTGSVGSVGWVGFVGFELSDGGFSWIVLLITYLTQANSVNWCKKIKRS